jgi:hypothetical protein
MATVRFIALMLLPGAALLLLPPALSVLLVLLLAQLLLLTVRGTQACAASNVPADRCVSSTCMQQTPTMQQLASWQALNK